MASAHGVRTVYEDNNVGLDDWYVLIPSLPQSVSSITAFDSSGETMELGICDAGDSANSEVRQLLISPGGISAKIQIASGQRVSIRAVSNTALAGENDLNVIY